jgi:predicted HicB family RNase H-like nuclease
MGRPPKRTSEKRSKTVRLRISAAEHRKLSEKAKAAGLSVSEFLRRATEGD